MQTEIKALLIDPYERVIKEITFVPTLENFYTLIGCQTIAVFSDTSGADFTYDDEYLIGRKEAAFCILAGWIQPMGGRLIATGPPDDEGECTDITPAQVDDILRRLNWVRPILADFSAN